MAAVFVLVVLVASAPADDAAGQASDWGWDTGALITLPPRVALSWSRSQPSLALDVSMPWMIQFGNRERALRPHRAVIEPGVLFTSPASPYLRAAYEYTRHPSDEWFGFGLGAGATMRAGASILFGPSVELLAHLGKTDGPGFLVASLRCEWLGGELVCGGGVGARYW